MKKVTNKQLLLAFRCACLCLCTGCVGGLSVGWWWETAPPPPVNHHRPMSIPPPPRHQR
jgi:hypothetical protein